METRSLADFVLKSKDTFMKRVGECLRPIFDRTTPKGIRQASATRNALKALPAAVKPFRAQYWKVTALAVALREYRSVGLIGEMGVGKTLCGVWLTWLHSYLKAYETKAHEVGKSGVVDPHALRVSPKTLIICPPTLVSTWEGDIRKAFGNKPVQIFNLNSPDALLKLTRLKAGHFNPDDPVYCIMGFNRAKTGPKWKPVRVKVKRITPASTPKAKATRIGLDICPHCSTQLEEELDQKVRRRCAKCKAPLWAPDVEQSSYLEWELKSGSVGRQVHPTRIKAQLDRQRSSLKSGRKVGRRRWAPALYVAKHMEGFFDFLLADEAHMLKGGDTIQGAVLGQLASACKKTVLLTGTLSGGKASDVFYLLQRAIALNMKDGQRAELLPAFKSVQEFVNRYGTLEETYRSETVDKVTGRASKESVTTKEKPGVSPELIKLFLPFIATLRISDIADQLPDYEEIVSEVELPDEVRPHYELFEKELVDQAKAHMKDGDMTVLGKMLNNLLGWPDHPQKGAAVTNKKEQVVARAPAIDITRTIKDEDLVRIFREAKAQGRKVMVYVEYTKAWNMLEYVSNMLEAAGFSVAVLRETIPSEKRLDWIERRFPADGGGPDGLITNSRLVQVGMNLRMFPEIVFFQTGYSIYTLRQAARRSWRPGQTQDVCVTFQVYANTLQAQAMRLIASKLQAALVLEGELVDGGLAMLSEISDSMVIALAKSLVEGNKAGETLGSQLSKHTRKGSCDEDGFDYDFGYDGPPIKGVSVAAVNEQPAQVHEEPRLFELAPEPAGSHPAIQVEAEEVLIEPEPEVEKLTPKREIRVGDAYYRPGAGGEIRLGRKRLRLDQYGRAHAGAACVALMRDDMSLEYVREGKTLWLVPKAGLLPGLVLEGQFDVVEYQ